MPHALLPHQDPLHTQTTPLGHATPLPAYLEAMGGSDPRLAGSLDEDTSSAPADVFAGNAGWADCPPSTERLGVRELARFEPSAWQFEA